jgi:hypothetical protein
VAQYFKLALLRMAGFLPDRPYVHLFYWVRTGNRLHLKNPKGFTQKIQWLKVHGNLEQFAPYADKYTVREYVERTVGAEHLIPILGVWDTFDEIPFGELPNRFVLKVTNGCGYNYICKDKAAMDRVALKSQVEAWQYEDFYRLEREGQYKSSKPRIVCEQYLEDDSGALRDYKIHCSKGKPRYIQIDVNRFTNLQEEMRDPRWRKVAARPSVVGFAETKTPVPKPKNLDQMLELATRLSAPFPYVRVDLYTVGDKIYFGELTFTPGSGTVSLTPAESEIAFGNLIDLDAYRNTLTA